MSPKSEAMVMFQTLEINFNLNPVSNNCLDVCYLFIFFYIDHLQKKII